MYLRSLSLVIILLIGLCFCPVMGGKVLPDKDLSLDNPQLKLSTELLQLTNSSYLPAETTRQDLTSQLEEQRAYQSSGQVIQGGVDVGAPSEVVYVYVTLSEGTPTSDVDPYAWDVCNRDESWRTVAAWVEVSRLLALASVPGVTEIRSVLPPVTNMGSKTAESDHLQLADQVRTQYGLTGSGVRIGVISDGVDSWRSAKASGDLPESLHVLSNTQGGDEGTAMLEIVYDIAPGAELYFHDCGANTMAFNSAVDALVTAGCTVIVDDIGWLSEPCFEDGLVASHIQYLVNTQKLIYISSAGNSAQRHYQGTYLNDGYDWHDFSGGKGDDLKYLYIDVPPGGGFRAVLNWDDPWTGSSNDYDLYLFEYGVWGNPIAGSTVTQNGNVKPLEAFTFTNNRGTTIITELNVLNVEGFAAPRNLEIYIYPSGGTSVYLDNIVVADSVFGHPAVTNVVAVGAIDAANPGTDTIEPFSSRGPVTIRGAAQRQKPDVTGIDGVIVTGAGGFPKKFHGTSASAPGVAAVVALVWSGAPNAAATTVRTALLSSAVDLGSAGRDNTFGYGRANALTFTQTLGIWPNPTVASITPNTGAQGATVQIEDLVGTGFQPGATVKLQRTGSADISGTNVTVVSPTKITCQFEMPSNAVIDAWNVIVINPDSRNTILTNGFAITVPGVADFTATPTSGPLPLDVQFTDNTSTSSPTSWSWTFSDGATSTAQHPVHTYTEAGNHTVSLSVNNGAYICTRPAYIKVTPVLFGDANNNNEVNQADTVCVLKQVVGHTDKPEKNTEVFKKTDVSRNGVIDVGDAMFIAQYNVGLRGPWFEIV